MLFVLVNYTKPQKHLCLYILVIIIINYIIILVHQIKPIRIEKCCFGNQFK